MKRMKKLFLLSLMCFSLFVSLPADAEGMLNDYDLPRVVDDADLLTDSEEEKLADKIYELAEKYDFDIVIVTADTIDGKTPMEYADDYFDYNGYGAGTDNDGILFLISMEERDWHISTTGRHGIESFTDYDIDVIGDKVVPYLSDGDYDEAFNTFLFLTENFLSEAEKGTPYDIDHKYAEAENKTVVDYLSLIGGSFIIGLIAAIIVVMVMKSKMKSVVFQSNANNYVINNSLHLDRSNDVFLYRNISKTRKPPENSGSGGSGSGGSSTHVSSSGTTHGGGGGKF